MLCMAWIFFGLGYESVQQTHTKKNFLFKNFITREEGSGNKYPSFFGPSFMNDFLQKNFSEILRILNSIKSSLNYSFNLTIWNLIKAVLGTERT